MAPKDHTQRIDLPSTCALHTEKLYSMADKLDEIHRRLFIDNGEPCLQSKIRTHDGVIKTIIWVVGVVFVTLVGVVVRGWEALK
jgi:hypothetical protein